MEADTNIYPSALATYEEVVASPKLFMETLEKLHKSIGTKFIARRGRIYIPQDELARSGLSEDNIFKGKVTEKWRNFMKGQIKRARMFFDVGPWL